MIGAAFTSISFVTVATTSAAWRQRLTIVFIAACAVIYALIGQPPQVILIFAGAFNGLILPLGVGVLLWVAWRRRDLLGGYHYPRWLLVVGGLAWLVTLFLGLSALTGLERLAG